MATKGGKNGSGVRTSIERFATGSCSGAASSLALQPFDLVKTRWQAHATALGKDAKPASAANLLGFTSSLVREEGVGSLWRGAVPSVGRVVIGVGVYFTTLESLLDAGGGAFMAGFLSRLLAVVVENPLTVVKARIEAAGKGGGGGGVGGIGGGSAGDAAQSGGGTIARLRRIAVHEGVTRGLFRGLGVSAVRDAPFSGVYLASYQAMRSMTRDIKAEGPRRLSDDATTMAISLVAGALATVATHPADVVKTRVQVGSATDGLAATTTGAIAAIARTEGARGFFRGVSLRLAKRPTQAALVWALYERFGPRGRSGTAPQARDEREERSR